MRVNDCISFYYDNVLVWVILKTLEFTLNLAFNPMICLSPSCVFSIIYEWRLMFVFEVVVYVEKWSREIRFLHLNLFHVMMVKMFGLVTCVDDTWI